MTLSAAERYLSHISPKGGPLKYESEDNIPLSHAHPYREARSFPRKEIGKPSVRFSVGETLTEIIANPVQIHFTGAALIIRALHLFGHFGWVREEHDLFFWTKYYKIKEEHGRGSVVRWCL